MSQDSSTSLFPWSFILKGPSSFLALRFLSRFQTIKSINILTNVATPKPSQPSIPLTPLNSPITALSSHSKPQSLLSARLPFALSRSDTRTPLHAQVHTVTPISLNPLVKTSGGTLSQAIATTAKMTAP